MCVCVCLSPLFQAKKRAVTFSVFPLYYNKSREENGNCFALPLSHSTCPLNPKLVVGRTEIFLGRALSPLGSNLRTRMVVFKNRYLLMEILWFGTPLAESSSTLSPSVVSAAIQESLQLNFGDHGLGTSLPSLQVKYVNPITSLCLVRCSRQEYQKVWCSISFVTSLRKYPVVFNLLDLSGNIKSCQKIIPKCEAEKLKHLKLKLGASLTLSHVEAANSIAQRALTMEG